jgi:hypothetical protein
MSHRIARLCVLICCLFVVQGALAEEAKPTPNANGCSYLNIYINSPSGPASVTSSGVGCDRGYLGNISPSQDNTNLVVLGQSLSYGPDCTVAIRVGGSISVIRSQQNYCFMEAGNVLAHVVSGRAVIDRTEPGSYARSQPGKVWVTVN